MAKVILTQSIASASGAYAPGDVYECSSKEEAARLIERGIAKAMPKGREKAVKAKIAIETRAKAQKKNALRRLFGG